MRKTFLKTLGALLAFVAMVPFIIVYEISRSVTYICLSAICIMF